MKTILVPTDFSKHARWALKLASKIAKQAKASVTLLHIVEHPGSDSFNVAGQVAVDVGWEDKLYTLKLIERARKQLAEGADSLAQEGLEYKIVLRMGNAFHGISTEIMEQEADLVVIGSIGESEQDQLIRGSNTEKVIRFSKCPVLTVHEDPGTETIKDIVYASSLAEHELNFGYVVKRMQELLGTTVHLVHINTPMNFQPDRIVKPVMLAFAKKLKLENYTLNMCSDLDAQTGIIHFAGNVKSGLICMTTHGYSGLSYLMMGSIAEDVVRHTRKPMLTLVQKDVAS